MKRIQVFDQTASKQKEKTINVENKISTKNLRLMRSVDYAAKSSRR